MTPTEAELLRAVEKASNHYREATTLSGMNGARILWLEALDALSAYRAQPAAEGKMVEVRCCLAAQPDGKWNCVGWGWPEGPEEDEEMARQACDFGGNDARVIAWVTARVPLPVTPTVEGVVT